jgi:ADP-dependent NAD(P)H-hydrate dehydratase / NAD(P)H-hydrate epimerase
MKIVSTAEMRAIDRATSERFGVPSLILMENAGGAVARFVLSDFGHAERIGVLCGKGNNGGDGLVAARKLAEAGRAVRVLLLSDPGELRGDAAVMFGRIRVKIAPLIVTGVEALNSAAATEVFASDLLLDAVLGTGFRPPVSELYRAAIEKMNGSSAAIMAVDIPSGADADAVKHGQGTVARADAIITFTTPRPAHVFAEMTSGPTVIAPIGSPDEAITSELGLSLSTPRDFADFLGPRALEANKGSYGHVLVVGGSVGKAGAAAMAGFAALRAGAGLSTIATPKSVVATVAGFHPEAMTEPLPETDAGTICSAALANVRELADRKSVLAIGPGISRHPQTAEFVRATLKPGTIPAGGAFVVDADALNAFEGAAAELNGHGRTLVVTPHPGEMSRLTGLSIAEIQSNRLEVTRRFAREHELIVVLKGHRTLIASPAGTVWVNPTGNPGMATGGTGDVLTGIVAGMLAQHPKKVLEATALAVYLHGQAGDLARDELGEHGLVATDLIKFLPASIQKAAANAQLNEFRLQT